MRLSLCFLSLLILAACTCTGFNDEKYSFIRDEQGIRITSDSIDIRLTVYRDDIIKMNYFTVIPEIENEESFCIVLKQDTNIRFRIKEDKDNLRIITSKIIAEVAKNPFNINFYDRKNKPLTLVSRGLNPWGVFLNNTCPENFNLGKTDPKEWYYTVEDGSYVCFLIQGDQPQDLLRKYYELTGYIPMLPKWTLGLLQGKNINENVQRLDSVFSDFTSFLPYGAFSWPVDSSEYWKALKLQIPVLKEKSIQHILHKTMDSSVVFTKNSDDKILIKTELYSRWFEMAVFSSFLKTYTVEGQSFEPIVSDELTDVITSSYFKLRYRLTPYLYSYMHRTSENGEPLIKPLFFSFDDPKAAQYQDSEYMFGNEFLVAPVTEQGQIRKTIYLPQLEDGYVWIDYWTDEPMEGGNEYSVKVPVQEIPLFIKQPAIIPMAKLKTHVDESPDDTLTIDIYPGGHAEFLLYEDDGITNDYLKGEYSITVLETDMAGKDMLVDIPATEGTYPDMVEERTWLLAIHLVEGFDEIRVNNNKISPVEYVRALSRNTYYYDLNSYLLVMDVGGSTSEGISVKVKKCHLIQFD